MPRLISGSTLRRGGSGEFIDLRGAMPQLPPSETTATGFTLVTDSLLRTYYRSGIGFVEFHSSTLYSSLPDGTIRIRATGTSFTSVNTITGTLVVDGGIGVGANMHIKDDITVNSLLIGQGFANPDDGAYNNIVIRGTATPTINDFENGQNSVAIGYDALVNLDSSYKSIAIGRYALSTGTRIRNSIAIGDCALKENGVVYDQFHLPITGVTVHPSKLISNISNSLPAVVTVVGHGLSTGSRISIYSVNGISTGTFSWVNGQSFYIDPLTSDTFSIYNDIAFTTSTAVDTRLFKASAYINSGTLVYPLEITVPNNDYSTGTAIQLTNLDDTAGLTELDYYVFYTYPLGSNVFQLYTDTILSEGVDGTNLTPYVTGGTSTRVMLSSNNIAIGTNAGKSLYDGERNFFLGDHIAESLTTGSYNFFIGHQVGNNLIKGSGNVSIMGDNLIDGQDNQVNIGGVFYYNGQGYLKLNGDTRLGLGTSATTSSGALEVLGGIHVTDNVMTGGIVEIRSTATSTATTNGALIVAGGVGVSGDLRVGGLIYGTVSGAGSSDTATNLAGGSAGSIPYQTLSGTTKFIDIGNPGTVLTSNGSTATWTLPTNVNYYKVTSSITAVNGQRIIADTSTGSFTINLPPTPVSGDTIVIVDGSNWADTGKNLIIGRNGSTIMNDTQDLVANLGHIRLELVYTGVTWDAYASVTSPNVQLVNDTTSTNVQYLTMSRLTSGTWTTSYVSDAKLYFYPDTGVLNATNFNSLSDISLKENIQPIVESLEVIEQINPVKFTWRDSKKTSFGVIAQELETVLPDLVETNLETGIKSVSYDQIIPLLVTAIKQQQAQINSLKKKLGLEE